MIRPSLGIPPFSADGEIGRVQTQFGTHTHLERSNNRLGGLVSSSSSQFPSCLPKAITSLLSFESTHLHCEKKNLRPLGHVYSQDFRGITERNMRRTPRCPQLAAKERLHVGHTPSKNGRDRSHPLIGLGKTIERRVESRRFTKFPRLG